MIVKDEDPLHSLIRSMIKYVLASSLLGGILVKVSDHNVQEEDQKRREARQAAKKQQQHLLQQRQQQLAQMNAAAAMPQQPGASPVARDGQIRGVIRSSGKWNAAANQQ